MPPVAVYADHQDAHNYRGQPVGPPQYHGKGHRRRIQSDACRQATLYEKDPANQRPRLGVEALLQILIGGIDFRTVKDGHGGRRENHHRQREAKVELHKAHAVDIGLPRGRYERDCAGLRSHDGKAHRIPGHCLACQ